MTYVEKSAICTLNIKILLYIPAYLNQSNTFFFFVIDTVGYILHDIEYIYIVFACHTFVSENSENYTAYLTFKSDNGKYMLCNSPTFYHFCEVLVQAYSSASWGWPIRKNHTFWKPWN